LCLGSISWEDLIKEVGQERHPLVGVVYCCIGCWSCNLHHDAVGALCRGTPGWEAPDRGPRASGWMAFEVGLA
jgi:hypothetical protein